MIQQCCANLKIELLESGIIPVPGLRTFGETRLIDDSFSGVPALDENIRLDY